MLLVLDLRRYSDAVELAESLANPWQNHQLSRFSHRKPKGRLLLLIPDGQETDVPRIEAPHAMAVPDPVRRNPMAYSRLIVPDLSDDAQQCWFALDTLARLVHRDALPGLTMLSQTNVIRALNELADADVVELDSDYVQTRLPFPAGGGATDRQTAFVELLATHYRFTRDPDSACDLARLAPLRFVASGSLWGLVPDTVRQLRTQWRHEAAIQLASIGSGADEVVWELARTLLDQGRNNEAIEVLTPVPAIDSDTVRQSFAALVQEGIENQADDLLRHLAQDPVDGEAGTCLKAHILYADGEAEKALELLAEVGDSESTACLVRSRCNLLLGRIESAREDLQSLGREHLQVGSARTRGNMAIALLSEGRYEDAASEFEAVSLLFEQAGLGLERAITLANMAIAREYLGHYGVAEEAFKDSVQQLDVLPSFHGRIRNLLALADVQTTIGRAASARRLCALAEESAKQAGHTKLEIDAIIRRARAFMMDEQYVAADGHLDRALTLCVEPEAERDARIQILRMQNTLLAGGTLNDPGQAPAEIGLSTRQAWDWTRAWSLAVTESERAIAILAPLIEQSDQTGDAALRWEARIILSAAYRSQGESGQANRVLREARTIIIELGESVLDSDRDGFIGRPWFKKLEGFAQRQEKRMEQPTQPDIVTKPSRTPGRIAGQHPALLRTLALAERYASSDAPVLLEGESGTGKELVAEVIHSWSNRSHGPMVRVNVAALAETLLLSELFGHERGAFTGAYRKKPGKFELANGGTLFLDEIGDLSMGAQVALLRVLQDGTFHRVGGTEIVRSDARVVLATNRNLKELVDQGRFRLDLYYRISGMTLGLPSLRNRISDLRALAHSIIAELPFAEDVEIDSDAFDVLETYDWPGNTRELRNVLERLIHLSENGRITADLVRLFGPGEAKGLNSTEDRPVSLDDWQLTPGFSLKRLQRQIELEYIAKAMKQSDGNIAAAARLLGMTRTILSRKVKEYGLK